MEGAILLSTLYKYNLCFLPGQKKKNFQEESYKSVLKKELNPRRWPVGINLRGVKMRKFLKEFGKDFELYIGSVFLSLTTVIVIMNVFTRYFLRFTFHWSEEIAVSCFVWTIFLGFASAYKTNDLIGVEFLLKMLPKKGRVVLEFFTSLIVTILSSVMLYFSCKYVLGSTKITAALEISYKYIYTSILIAFTLVTLYSIYFSVQSFKKIFSKENIEN